MLLAVALLPTARSWREAATLVGVSAAPSLLTIAPFFVAEPRATLEALRYIGLVGLGGLSVVIKPALAEGWMGPMYEEKRGPVVEFHRPLQALTVAAVLAVGARVRERPLELVCLMFLAVWSFTAVWSYTYLVWGIPFLIVAGRWWIAGAITALSLPVVLIHHSAPHDGAVVTIYTVAVIALWVVTAGGAVAVARDLLRRRYPPAKATRGSAPGSISASSDAASASSSGSGAVAIAKTPFS